ncbi:MAG: 2-oxoglutarate dehydrogenase E1 component [Methylococcales bacterium]
MNDLLQHFRESSAYYGANASFIEDLYEQFLKEPDSVGETWRERFKTLQNQVPIQKDIPHSPIRNRFARLAENPPAATARFSAAEAEISLQKQSSVTRLIYHYRIGGHLQANCDPLGLNPRPPVPDLDLTYYGLSDLDMNTVFDTGTLFGDEKLPLHRILSSLKETYCGNIGSEYSHIVDIGINSWITHRLESSRGKIELSHEKKRKTLRLVTAAEGIENYLHRKYVGQKRFSLEGGESLIPLLDELVQTAGSYGSKEVVVGMAHRGRLNVLINVLGKRPSILFDEFEGSYSTLQQASAGDVKYHMGFSSDVDTPGGPVHLALAFNPSHLEIINPVVEGSVRARQDRRGKKGALEVLPILIHGDAAFAGQGVVMETLNLAETPAYSTGGTVHIVINNQIGFTTSNSFDARSTLYCTDVANMVQAPVFHVNGDDPEAVLFVTRLALDYRTEFQKDVVIDLVCYRRHGHNEADEPAVTQPIMYQKIRNHATTRKIYADKLIRENILSAEEAEKMMENYIQALEKGEKIDYPVLAKVVNSYTVKWNQFFGTNWKTSCNTALPLDQLRALTEKLTEQPPGFELHPRVAKIQENRIKMAAGALPIDWGFAETLAYASLLTQGRCVRLTGQDVGRGTFFHRHAILHNQINGEIYIPLNHLSANQANFYVYNSLLSEEGVLGFEYGYSTAEPDSLVIWEAQFGDFANGAQVVIDQFISSGESKWGRLCALTMLLPHGYEGQGAEHSSARLERFLQLCAEHNLQICVPTTPAQIFHLLRRQVLRPYRKPLIVMSPKSLLRHKLAVSNLEQISNGHFFPLIGEIDEISPRKITRVVLCSGKVYFDLLEARREQQLDHVAILRIEQLYPFPLGQLTNELKHYPKMKELIWCQEEPQNQGAWYQIKHRFLNLVGDRIRLEYAGRPMSASPAEGNFKRHIEGQRKVVEIALNGKAPT